MLGSLAASNGKASAGSDRPFLYISGEEAPAQIAARGRRLGRATRERKSARSRAAKSSPLVYDFDSDQLLLASATDLDRILAMLEERRPRIAVIDSIQTLRDTRLASAPGSAAG